MEEIRQHSVVLLRGELLSVASVARLERVALGENHPEEVRRRVVDALARCPLDDAASALFTLLQPRGLLELGSHRDAVALLSVARGRVADRLPALRARCVEPYAFDRDRGSASPVIDVAREAPLSRKPT